MVNVLLVEDTRMSRDCISGYIKSSEHYRLAATISGAGMAEITCMRTPVDLILMDYRTENNEDGIEAAAVIKRHMPKIKIIIVTSMTSSDLIRSEERRVGKGHGQQEPTAFGIRRPAMRSCSQ